MSTQRTNLLFVGNGRCYHTMDWYRNTRRLCAPQRVAFATDLIDSEGHVKLITADDDIVGLYNIDKLLLSRQSAVGNAWRNAVKLLLLPLQVVRLRRLARDTGAALLHAHSMYYMWMCWLAGLPFVGTPQGSELLVRPNRSVYYRYLTIRALKAALHVTVDSVAMQEAILRLSGRRATIVQNGIDVSAIRSYANPQTPRTRVLSIRGFHPIYRIREIVAARDASVSRPSLVFTYATWQDEYRADVRRGLSPGDQDLGRVMPKEALYEILAATRLAISIPTSDSSPRSVYEAVFCGCCVAVAPSGYVDALPECMRARLFIVDVGDPRWFDKAIEYAEQITGTPYQPSPAALSLLDQSEAAKIVVELYHRPRS